MDILNGTGDSWNESFVQNDTGIYYDHRAEMIAVPIVFALIFIIGVVGNGTLIFTVIRNENMRNAPNIFIVSLAMGDLLLILVTVPFTVILYATQEGWPFGQSICKLNEGLQTLSLGVSVFTLMALSADRYIAIMNPLQHRTSCTKATFWIAAIIWFVSLLLSCIDTVAARVEKESYENVTYFCSVYPSTWPDWYPRAYVIYRFILYFAVPLIIIGCFYMAMAHTLILSSKQVVGEGARMGQIQRQMNARRKVAKIVLCFVFIFFVCWLPKHIYLFWFHFDTSEYNLFWHLFKIIGFCLSFINSCVNPIALYFLSKQFRKYYNRYLFCYLPSARNESTKDYASVNKFHSIRTSTTAIHNHALTSNGEQLNKMKLLSDHSPHIHDNDDMNKRAETSLSCALRN